MDLRLKGRRALITGGSKGIGKAAATCLAAEGCDLLLVARTQTALDDTASAVRGRHQVDVRTLAADLSSDEQARSVAQAAGAFDILVNNAGAIPPGSLQKVDDATWRKAWDLKVFGFISLTRAAYPMLASRQDAVIVNVIGSAGERFDPNYITGSTGNAALMAFTRALGRTSHADGIRVVGINPGPVLTERLEMLLRARAERELADAGRWSELLRGLPFGRAAHAEEIGAAVAFLASPLAGYVSGTILTIDGGG